MGFFEKCVFLLSFFLERTIKHMINNETSKALQEWYDKNKRDLPWRQTKDPYLIWVSEIILQQTQVAQGLDYYCSFVRRFPDIQRLAEAEEVEVLKYWQGLGYYSRARHMHESAKTINERFKGIFPNQYKDVLTLKGVGEYTAAAIVSLAHNQPYPVVDGNVYRVLARLFAIDTPIDTEKGKKEFHALAAALMPPDQAHIHNQAIMEFGALQCVPKNPDCTSCPLSCKCLGYATGRQLQYPIKQNKTKTRDRYLHYFFILNGSDTYIRRRSGKDIWKGLYELPLIETETKMDFAELKEETTFRQLFDRTGQTDFFNADVNIKHVLSHQILHTTFYEANIQIENPTLLTYVKIPLSSLDEYPFPTLLRAYLDRKINAIINR